MPRREQFGPQLLVSVRSREEALCAVNGGAQILDVKEPAHGSLGMSPLNVIEEISTCVQNGQLEVPLSVALGETSDWDECTDAPRLPAAVTYAKLGLSNILGNVDWHATWRRIRNQFDHHRQSPLKWVAVAYADYDAARSMCPEQILAAAIESDCAGLLIDTFSKTGRNLTDFVGAERLTELADTCHASGLFLALAGSLGINRLAQLRGVGADVIAIRSAACQNSIRCGHVDISSVMSFQAAMARSFERHLIPRR